MHVRKSQSSQMVCFQHLRCQITHSSFQSLFGERWSSPQTACASIGGCKPRHSVCSAMRPSQDGGERSEPPPLRMIMMVAIEKNELLIQCASRDWVKRFLASAGVRCAHRYPASPPSVLSVLLKLSALRAILAIHCRSQSVLTPV